MDAITAIESRFSARAFLDKPVTDSCLEQLFSAARWAPSGVNTQPWQVIIAGPDVRRRIGERFIAEREAGRAPNPDYAYYPPEWAEPYKSRRKACGLALYGALGISREETERRKAQWYRNYHFFEAPVGCFFVMDRSLEKGSWLDFGMFLQSVMIAAKGLGLDTCPEASMSEYPDVVRQALSLGDEMAVVCGMAIGYADMAHPINQYRTEREPVSAFMRKVD